MHHEQLEEGQLEAQEPLHSQVKSPPSGLVPRF
jgi:hypothetical protein